MAIATSTIVLYKDCKITPDRNCIVDDVDVYLSTLTYKTVTNYQYQKLDDVFLEIRLDLAQSEVISDYNYCKLTQDSQNYYYFITATRWKAQSTVQFELAMDTLQTFKGKYTISSKSNIIRQHTQRFPTTQKFNAGGFYLSGNIDKVSEGIKPILYLNSNTTVEDSNISNKTTDHWYLVYQTDVSTDNAPLTVYLYPKSNQVPYGDSYSLTATIHYYDIPEGTTWYCADYTNNQLFYLYHEPGYTLLRKGDWTVDTQGNMQGTAGTYMSSYTFSNEVDYYIYNGDPFNNPAKFENMHLLIHNIIKAGATGTAYLQSISSVDRSNPAIVKIIECPYCPVKIRWNGNVIDLSNVPNLSRTADGRLVFSDYTTEYIENLGSQLISELIYNFSTMTQEEFMTLPYDYTINSRYVEPKLLHSDLYMYKQNYDTFNNIIQLENWERSNLTSVVYTIDYKQSNNLNSELAFKTNISNGKYKSELDYPEYMISVRDNELALINNEYLNYMRVGYEYDKQKKELTNQQNWVNVAGTFVRIAGAVAAAALGGGGISWMLIGSSAASAISAVSSAITNDVQAEQDIAQKINELKNQSSSVSTSNAIDIFNYYNGNKLVIKRYKMSDKLEQDVLDLFHYCGYTRNRQETINTDNRIWFNYVQLEAIFLDNIKIPQTFLNDIKARYAAGVTIYHHQTISSRVVYDWDRQYANWEKSIIS